jgi:hypothetical protein
MLAHLHVVGCPCSRCRVSRNYARLLATVTPGPEADAAEPVAAEPVVPLFQPDTADANMVAHG